MKTIGEVPADPHTAVPKNRVKIIDCGLNELDRKYDLSEDQLDSTDDLWTLPASFYLYLVVIEGGSA